MPDDPYAVLGVSPGITEDELRGVRRRLAQELHPDHAGGTTEAMRRLNLAFDAVLADVTRPVRAPASSSGGPTAPVTVDVVAPVPRPGGRLAHDVASFTIEALPVEAFEALLVVATWIGEVIVDEPPYQLDVALGEPFDCFCRLDLVPDAGATTVALTLASLDGRPVPDLDAVRDAWVANLNTLGHPDP
ncbi:MAG: J domain-containing protein [Ilumatobacteraceae bacterium]